jgi:hypothetical protein
VHKPQASWLIGEMNNILEDGNEVAIYTSPLPDGYRHPPPLVFNLSRCAPQPLPFRSRTRISSP